MKSPDFVRQYWAECLLCGILLLAAFLNLWNIWNQGMTNFYYGAAVKSMLVNPIAGFFNSLDPAGFITVDKPPVGLWVQALFAALFGFKGWVLVLPQALAGVGSVALIYIIVSRSFGKPAGLVAALALTLTPIFVAIARNGTMDTQLIFVLLLAVWAVLKATRDQSLHWLLVAAVLVGIGFNIKMIQAFIVIPAIFGVYFIGTADISWRKRIFHIGLALLVLLAVSLSWAIAVDLIPADQRPYIGGSGDNTVLGLIVNYNGLHRLGIGDSMGGGPGGGSQSGSGSSFMGPGGSPGNIGSPNGGSQQNPPGRGMLGSSGPNGGSAPGGGGMPSGGGMNSGGEPGIFRVFNNGLAGDISWLLAFALIGLLAWVRKTTTFTFKGLEEAGYTSERYLVIIAMLLWLVPGLHYFSFTTGFWHDYYIATLAPPIAGLVGIGAMGMYERFVNGSRAGWILVAAVLVTGLLQTLFLSYNADFAGPLVPIVFVGTLVCTAILAGILLKETPVLVNHRLHIVAIAVAILFLAPLVWSYTPILTGNGGTIPSAGPQKFGGGVGNTMTGNSGPSNMVTPINGGVSGNMTDRDVMPGVPGNTAFGQSTSDSSMNSTTLGGPMGPSTDASSNSLLEAYLLSHTTNETWILAVSNAEAGAYIIMDTGKPVMCLGGFMGSDNAISLTSIETYIKEDKVRYFETGGNGVDVGSSMGGNSAIFSWVETHCSVVNVTGTTNGSLYDCKGAV